MALNTNELYSRVTVDPHRKRIQPAEGPGSVVVAQFDTGTAETLPVGTPVYVKSTGFVAKIVPAGNAHAGMAATDDEAIYGFIYPSPVTVSTTDQVHGTVMIKGQIHVDEVEAIRAAGFLASSNANLLICLRNPIVRYRGLHIDGLTLSN